jgi:hypothetical protein
LAMKALRLLAAEAGVRWDNEEVPLMEIADWSDPLVADGRIAEVHETFRRAAKHWYDDEADQ